MAFAGAQAIGALITVGSQIRQGELSRGLQKRASIAQERVQRQATATAVGQQRKSEMAVRAANQKEPDISAIMAAAQGATKPATMLSGIGGVTADQLKLQRPKLLGE